MKSSLNFGFAFFPCLVAAANAQTNCFNLCQWCTGSCSPIACDVDDQVTCDSREGLCDTCTCDNCINAVNRCEGTTSEGGDCSIPCVWNAPTSECVVDKYACNVCNVVTKGVGCEAECDDCQARGCQYYRSGIDCSCDQCAHDSESCWGQSCSGSTPQCESGPDANSCDCYADCYADGSCGSQGCPELEFCLRDDTGKACACKSCTDSYQSCGIGRHYCLATQDCVINADGSDCECRYRWAPTDPPDTTTIDQWQTTSEDMMTTTAATMASVKFALVLTFGFCVAAFA